MSIELKKINTILENGEFHSEVSNAAKTALNDSIALRSKYKVKNKRQEILLDFTEVNKIAIQKRGNLKVYQDLPKGIRVVAR